MAKQLLEVAVDAGSALEQLATGLGQAGADDQTVQAVTQMAETTRKIVKALGKGQETTGDNEPPEPEQPQTMAGAEQGLVQDLAARRGG